MRFECLLKNFIIALLALFYVTLLIPSNPHRLYLKILYEFQVLLIYVQILLIYSQVSLKYLQIFLQILLIYLYDLFLKFYFVFLYENFRILSKNKIINKKLLKILFYDYVSHHLHNL